MNPKPSTRLLITAAAILMLAAFLVANSLWIWQREQSRLMDNQNSLLAGSLRLAESRVENSGQPADTDFHRSLIQDMNSQAHISKAHIISAVGLILDSSLEAEIGQTFVEQTPDSAATSVGNDSSRFQTFFNSTANLAGRLPLCPASSATAASCETLYLETASKQILDEARSELLTTQLWLFCTAIVICLFALLAILERGVFQPARHTMAKLDAFAAGDHNLRCSPHGVWELKSLIESVNNLFNKIQQGEKQLLEKQTMYAALLETMGDGLITMQPNGNIQTINRAAERLLGYQRKELVDQKFNRLFADEKISQSIEFSLPEYIQSNCPDNSDSHWEVCMQTKDGSRVPARISIRNMIIDNENTYICVLSDIADIKEMEQELLQLNEQLSLTNEQLAQSAITDSLTGLYNRRHFDATFSKELARSTRQAACLSLLIVDIDFFKEYNDRYGHLLGDDCLSRVGECMNTIFKRSGDLPARYGGEEFAVVLPGCDGLDLQERAETLRLEIENLRMPHAGSSVSEVVTVSIGAVTYRPQGDVVVTPKPRELFKEADRALYRAKNRGRNRVEFAGIYEASSLTLESQIAESLLTRRIPINSIPE